MLGIILDFFEFFLKPDDVIPAPNCAKLRRGEAI
jgi:hypothetical protein